MEKSAHVIRICVECTDHRKSGVICEELPNFGVPRPCGICLDLVKIQAQYNVPVAMGVAEAADHWHIVAESTRAVLCFKKIAATCTRLWTRLRVKREIIW